MGRETAKERRREEREKREREGEREREREKERERKREREHNATPQYTSPNSNTSAGPFRGLMKKTTF
eukprot:3134267-Rhodomonas_salina.1